MDLEQLGEGKHPILAMRKEQHGARTMHNQRSGQSTARVRLDTVSRSGPFRVTPSRRVRDCYGLRHGFPVNRGTKILGHKPQRKHGPAVDDLRDDLGIRRIDRNVCTVDARSILADPECNGRASQLDRRPPGGPIPFHCPPEGFNNRPDRNERPPIPDDRWRIERLQTTIDSKRRLPI